MNTQGRSWSKWAIPLISLMLSAAYSNTCQSPLALDDFHTFVQDPSVRIDPTSWNNLLSLGETKFGISRWIPMLTFSWDIKVGQGEIFYFHLTNFIIHMLCFLSVFFFLSTLTEHVKANAPDGEAPPVPPFDIALWTAALWALNPVQTNAVTYIVQRMASLMALFSALSLAFYVLGRTASFKKGALTWKPIGYFGLCGLSLILGLLSKENTAIVPLLILMTEGWFFRPELFREITRFARKHWVWSTAALTAIVGIVLYAWPGVVGGYAGRHFTLEQRLLTQARIVVWYISVVIFPNPGRLSLEHDVELSTSLFSPPSTAICISIICLMVFASIYHRKKYPLISYGILWFLLSLVIESTVVPLELIFEHRMYFSSIGLILSVVVSAFTVFAHILKTMRENDFRKLSWSLFAIVASVLCLATFERNSTWQDSVTLNGDNVRKAPNNHRAHANYALALTQHHEYEKAIEEAKIAISLGKPYFESYCEAVNTIVLSYYGLGEYESAVTEGQRLIEEKPEGSGSMALPSSWIVIGYAYKEQGKLQEAYDAVFKALWYEQRLTMRVPHLQDASINLLEMLLAMARSKGVDLDRDGNADPGAHISKTWIAKVFLRLGETPKAGELLQEAVAENPADSESHQLLARLVDDQEKSRIQQAKSSFRTKYLYHPFSRFNACMALAFVAREKRLPSPFLELGEKFLDYALHLQPDSPDALLLKGWYHFERNEVEEAVELAKDAIRLDSDDAKAWLGLGFFLAKANRPQKAIMAFEKTLELYPHYPQRLAILDIAGKLRSTLHSLAKEDTAQTN